MKCCVFLKGTILLPVIIFFFKHIIRLYFEFTITIAIGLIVGEDSRVKGLPVWVKNTKVYVQIETWILASSHLYITVNCVFNVRFSPLNGDLAVRARVLNLQFWKETLCSLISSRESHMTCESQ